MEMGRNLLVNAIVSNPDCTWNKKVPGTRLEKFKGFIEKKYNIQFASYWELHKWSVDNFQDFWKEIWYHFDIIASKSYKKVFVKTGNGFLDNTWFTGARLNYAENLLRIRNDKVALILVDEHHSVETVTYAELFSQVKSFAAAFRKHGLKKGERVACYMSNRKEAIYAFLATASIGAVWGGPLPYYSANAAANMLKRIEPKFLIADDYHTCDGEEYKSIDNLSLISLHCTSLEKIIIVPTREETKQRNLSNIRKSILLEEFLEVSNCNTSDLIFEQLPFEHPLCINFTSGTTGMSKGVIHPIGCFIAQLRDLALHLNLRRGDVVCNYFPVGWSLWETFVPCLAFGIKLLLFNGYQGNKSYCMWDVFSDHKVTFSYIVPNILEKFDKAGIIPDATSNLDSLKFVALGGYPTNRQHVNYLTKVKSDLFIGSWYGSTEMFGAISGFDLNLHSYGGEIQLPALGVDLQCFNDKGRSVYGQRGELVIATPTPSFPTGIWRDDDKSKLNATYLNKFKGVWTQSDECWINPNTKGVIVIGRSDDTLNQDGERFCAGDIYSAIHGMEELLDYICVGQDLPDGRSRAVLFVKLRRGWTLTTQLKKKISLRVKEEFWADFAPKIIVQVPDIPYNLNNKKMESIVRKIVAENVCPETMSVRNPQCLKYFCDIPELLNQD